MEYLKIHCICNFLKNIAEITHNLYNLINKLKRDILTIFYDNSDEKKKKKIFEKRGREREKDSGEESRKRKRGRERKWERLKDVKKERGRRASATCLRAWMGPVDL